MPFTFYKYCDLPVIDGASIGGYVSINRFRDASAAMQYLAVPYSPLLRLNLVENPASPSALSFRLFQNHGRSEGFTVDGDQMRRVWPAFGRHGGAWERVLVDKHGIDSDLGTGWLWSTADSALTLPPHRISEGKFIRDTEWGILGNWISIIVRLIATAPAGVQADDDFAGDRNQSQDAPIGAVKPAGHVAGAVLRFYYAAAKFEYTISFLADFDRDDKWLIGLRLWGAIWRDVERGIKGPHERQLIYEGSMALRLPEKQGKPPDSGPLKFIDDNEWAIRDASTFLKQALRRAVDAFPTIVMPPQRVVRLLCPIRYGDEAISVCPCWEGCLHDDR